MSTDQPTYAPTEARAAAADAYDDAAVRRLDVGQMTAAIADAVWQVAIAVPDPTISLSPLTDDEAVAFLKARFLESMAHPQRLIALPPTDGERVDAAYQRGLDDGRRQRAAEIDAMTRSAYEDGKGDGRAEGRRQTTEGQRREWGLQWEPMPGQPSDHPDHIAVFHEESEALEIAPEWRNHRVVSRLVGPWEPVDPAPTAAHPEGGVRAAETALEGAEGGSEPGGHQSYTELRCIIVGPHERHTWSHHDDDSEPPCRGHVCPGERMPARTRVIHDPGALIEEPDEHCPAHGAHPHGGRVCLDCPICRPPAEPATGGTVAPHDQPTTEDGMPRDVSGHRIDCRCARCRPDLHLGGAS